MGFYTNVSLRGNKVLYRGFRKGERVQESVDYNPTLFVPSTEPTKFKTLDGNWVEPFRPGSIRDCRDFIKQYEGVSGFEIYGNSDYVYQFIGDLFKEEVNYDPSLVRIAYLDIETTCERGFPDVETQLKKLLLSPFVWILRLMFLPLAILVLMIGMLILTVLVASQICFDPSSRSGRNSTPTS